MNTQVASPETDQLFQQARTVLASGVSASLRMHAYLGKPLYMARGEGAWLVGVDGKRYLDFNLSNGAALLGHHHPSVQAAVAEGLEAGIITATETPFHERLGSCLVEIIPAAERVRFATVGSEVTAVAIRIARAATGRDRYLKFDGHFHGLSEPWLLKRRNTIGGAEAVTGSASKLIPSSGGVPTSQADDCVMIPFNDVPALEAAIDRHGDELAAIIVEPIHFNAGCIPPEQGFLERLRELTRQAGVILIFDEILSGFRTALGGVQAQYGVTPDLTTHAKALANGMPLASLSGKADLMELLAPAGPVSHSGTYSGHLLSVLAALATLEELRQPGRYETINATANRFYAELQAVFDRHALPVRVQGAGARFGVYFGRTEQVRTWADALAHDHDLNRRFAVKCIERRVYFHGYTTEGAPGHSGFSTAHTSEDFAFALTVIDDVCRELARG